MKKAVVEKRKKRGKPEVRVKKQKSAFHDSHTSSINDNDRPKKESKMAIALYVIIWFI